jgi:hypothetical protein
MFELAAAFIEPIQTGTQASNPEMTTLILENAIQLTAFRETLAAVRTGDIMCSCPRLPIQSVEGAWKEAEPQNALRVLMNRGDLAGRETIRAGRPSRIVAELPLPEIDDIEPAIGRRHPKHAGSIAVKSRPRRCR